MSLSSSRMSILAASMLAVGLFSTPAQAQLTVEGITYTLTESFIDATHELFTLNISGINTASDTRGGRTDIDGLAFTKPDNFVIAALTNPAGWTYQEGGLNSSGCDGSGAAFFCFKSTTYLVSGSTATFTFTETTSAPGSFPYTPSFKIDWSGTQNNYDLVSLPLTPTPPIPEPGTYAMMLAGLSVVGFMARRRQQRAD